MPSPSSAVSGSSRIHSGRRDRRRRASPMRRRCPCDDRRTGSDRRRWLTAGGTAHHLIDPRTGLPSKSDLLRVTALGPTAVEAEVTAKSLFLAGEEVAAREADAEGIPALLVTIDGRSRMVGGLA